MFGRLVQCSGHIKHILKAPSHRRYRNEPNETELVTLVRFSSVLLQWCEQAFTGRGPHVGSRFPDRKNKNSIARIVPSFNRTFVGETSRLSGNITPPLQGASQRHCAVSWDPQSRVELGHAIQYVLPMQIAVENFRIIVDSKVQRNLSRFFCTLLSTTLLRISGRKLL